MEAPHNGTLESRKRAAASVPRPQRSRILKKERKREIEEEKGRFEKSEERRMQPNTKCKARIAVLKKLYTACVFILGLH